MEKERKLAILIDAENIAYKYITVILNEATNLGDIVIKRIYGDWTAQQLGGWKNVIMDNCIQPIQQYHSVSGKNASDSALIIDAMDLLYQGRVDAFCIVSSDSDFTRLAARLRESEKYVLGLGEQKTPQSFISACNKFSYLDLLYDADPPAAAAEKPEKKSEEKNVKTGRKAAPEKPAAKETAKGGPGSKLKVVRQALRDLAEENSEDDGWITSSRLGELVNRKFPDFDVRNFGFKKFSLFVESLQIFETKRQASEGNKNHTIYFRIKE